MPDNRSFSNESASRAVWLQFETLRDAMSPVKHTDTRDEITLGFELGIYELGRTLYPRNARVLDGLVSAYCAAGRHGESLTTVRKLIELEPDNPRHHYNLACNQCRLDQPEAALESLQRAVAQGFNDFEFLLRDDDLAELRDSKEFHEFERLAQLQRNSQKR